MPPKVCTYASKCKVVPYRYVATVYTYALKFKVVPYRYVGNRYMASIGWSRVGVLRLGFLGSGFPVKPYKS